MSLKQTMDTCKTVFHQDKLVNVNLWKDAKNQVKFKMEKI